jgi:hypothetical protein
MVQTTKIGLLGLVAVAHVQARIGMFPALRMRPAHAQSASTGSTTTAEGTSTHIVIYSKQFNCVSQNNVTMSGSTM